MYPVGTHQPGRVCGGDVDPTPASSMSREEALEMITRERESRPAAPSLPIGKRHPSQS